MTNLYPAADSDAAANDLLRPVCDAQIHGVLEFAGRLDPERLRCALGLSLGAEPVLGCRWRPGFWRARWQRRADLDPYPWLSLQAIADERQAEADAQDWLARPLLPERDPLLQARLQRGPEADRLLLKFSHVVGDAAALKDVLYLLAALYRRLGDDPGYRPAPNPGLRDAAQLFAQFSHWRRLRLLRRSWRNLRALSPPRNWELGLAPARGPGYFYLAHLGPEEFQRLKAHAHRHQATLNDLLVCALGRALYRVIRPAAGLPLRLVTTVDLRRYLPQGRAQALCNLSGFAYLGLCREQLESADPAVTLAGVAARTQALKADDLGLGDAAFWLPLLRLLPHAWAERLSWSALERPKPGAMPPGFTNMGRIEPQALDFGGVRPTRAYLLPPLVFAPYVLLGASGYGDSLDLSLGVCGGDANRACAAALFEAWRQQLSWFSSHFT